ncbi:hypothetical protein, variant [Exophiala dermatitidis NIH/UT8656]|uniref:Uncharacterized protein n=1 Tax=Exophiala dermatitidis (strain ATCC 34100 / CBS 525.76 / NIH/UT8656) TaxID=858893 RepID=H6BV13_EXODN|nr:uncharacterized protein HMPREF1120_03919 [Exophiala dermatitidis NIH/UT8656]XP_009156258.1 hypothetical protein, variant [Exophiala dermatitidis NIH/UT8656]EHY55796.1 hypothetical protein, variant [Exophiala dermatitidis NIH/UT8656]EHY55797.1 hypothetical protein HMPREF1120_03919 [Exophiala dermatitidis NIH/UT8656]
MTRVAAAKRGNIWFKDRCGFWRVRSTVYGFFIPALPVQSQPDPCWGPRAPGWILLASLCKRLMPPRGYTAARLEVSWEGSIICPAHPAPVVCFQIPLMPTSWNWS